MMKKILMEGKLYGLRRTGASSLYIGVSLTLLIFGFLFYSKYELVSLLMILVGFTLVALTIYRVLLPDTLTWSLEEENGKSWFTVNYKGKSDKVEPPLHCKMSYYKSQIKRSIIQYHLCFSIEPDQGLPSYTFIETLPAGVNIPENCPERDTSNESEYVFSNSNGLFLKKVNLTQLYSRLAKKEIEDFQ